MSQTYGYSQEELHARELTATDILQMLEEAENQLQWAASRASEEAILFTRLAELQHRADTVIAAAELAKRRFTTAAQRRPSAP